jgi:hypothetical protein
MNSFIHLQSIAGCVANSNHWIFEGANLHDGDEFGREDSIAGWKPTRPTSNSWVADRGTPAVMAFQHTIRFSPSPMLPPESEVGYEGC